MDRVNGESRVRVRFCDGGTFETNAQSASQYLLDPVFIRYLFICIVLYGTLMYREDVAQLEPYSQVALWITMFVVTALWLGLSATVNLFLVRRGIVGDIFTPVLVLPLVVVNSAAASYVAEYLGAEFWITFPENIHTISQNLIAAICFDILHGRYVAPSHPTYIPSKGPVALQQAPVPGLRPAVAEPEEPEPQRPVSEVPAEVLRPETAVSEAAPQHMVTISNESFDLRNVVYIQSQDHYLKVQQSDKSSLTRGKLRDTVKQIDYRLGMQIDRSTWVAFSKIVRLEELPSGYIALTLADDTGLTVANSRKIAFLQNYKLYGEASD